MKTLSRNLVFAALGVTAVGMAQAIALLPADAVQNRAYVGLVWTVEKSSAVPDFVVGLRHAKTNADSDVTGYDVSARFKFNGNVGFDSVRAVYLDGNRNSQANLGLGYSVTHQSVFGTVGGSTEHLKLGLDYLFTPGTFDPFVEINTLDKPDASNFVPPI